MPKIVIRELDETLAGTPAATTDVAFVPGFAQTNANCYIFTNAGDSPSNFGTSGGQLTGTAVQFDKSGDPYLATSDRLNGVVGWAVGFVGPYGPNYACNIVDEKTWYCDPNGAEADDQGFVSSTTWKEQPVYIAPHAENYPTLCASISEFEHHFGKTPYQFGKNQNVSHLFSPTAISRGTTYMYKTGEYDKSYIYAKELIRKGIPVIYENITNRISKYSYFIIGTYVAPGVSAAVTTEEGEEALQEYLKNHGGKSFTITWKIIDSVGKFVIASGTKEKEFTLADTIFTIQNKANLTEGDTISISGSPTSIVDVTSTDGYVYKKEDPNVEYLYSMLSDCYTNSEKLLDKGELTVKYITSGAYPVYELSEEYECSTAMIGCAEKRGDAFAILDAYNNPEREINPNDESSVYYQVKNGNGIYKDDKYDTYATMFGPVWSTHYCVTAPKGATEQLMPPSFTYLIAMAESIITNPNWLAIAGINRGIASTIIKPNSVKRLSNTIADEYQPRDARALNAITNIKPYGYAIWGNRTLVSNADGNLTASSFLNVRCMVCDIKKTAYTAAKSVLFEQESDIMWNSFKTKMTPLLEKMKYGYGITEYRVIRSSTKYDGTPLAKGEVAAIIKICPRYAVEDVEITVVLTEDGVSVS